MYIDESQWHVEVNGMAKEDPRGCGVKHAPSGLELPFQRGDPLYTSESDVCRPQILTYKVDPRAERIEIFIMAVDPQHRYSNETERAN